MSHLLVVRRLWPERLLAWVLGSGPPRRPRVPHNRLRRRLGSEQATCPSWQLHKAFSTRSACAACGCWAVLELTCLHCATTAAHSEISEPQGVELVQSTRQQARCTSRQGQPRPCEQHLQPCCPDECLSARTKVSQGNASQT